MLEIEGLSAGYQGSAVLSGVDLTVPAGAVTALLGRNGVGKSTLVNTVMGLVRPTSGEVRVAGRGLAGRRADVVARAGVALVPQGRRVFGGLTVEEHLRIARPRGGGYGGVWTRDRVLELLPRLGERLRQRADLLSGGEQQMLAIARALLLSPRLLLLDEPSDGLAPSVVAQVGAVVRELAGQGLTILMAEQNLRLAFGCATRVAVLSRGRVELDVPVAAFRADRDRARALIGV
ncbi:ABC transporter ATP-binding protein [Catellatospora citrea]|uniref:ABC transporter ATP-binding protein n=1 Tax=Catellatospora citrea TaxID=53366 RepID=UPI0033F7D0B0